MSQTNPRSRVVLENLMFLYVNFNIILPFTLSLPAWFFPCRFLTQTLCIVLVPIIRATWLASLIVLNLAPRTIAVSLCQLTVPQRRGDVVYRLYFYFIAMTLVHMDSHAFWALNHKMSVFLRNTVLGVSEYSTPQSWAEFWGSCTNLLKTEFTFRISLMYSVVGKEFHWSELWMRLVL
jgi:hypothetical protein